MATGGSTLRGRFPDGTKVRAVPRLTDSYTETEAVETATTKGGETVFSSLEANAPYWAVGEVDGEERKVMFTAKDPQFEREHPDFRKSAYVAEQERKAHVKARSDLHAAAVANDPLAASPAPGKTLPASHPVHGPRTTAEELSRQRPVSEMGTEEIRQTAGQSPDRRPYSDRTVDELRQLAADRNVEGRSGMTKDELIEALRS